MAHMYQPGFMLFELMLVMVLILFCSTIGFISYTAFKGVSFSTDAAVFNLLLRTAASRATCLKKEQIITIDEFNNQLLYDGVGYPLQAGFRFDILPGTYGPPSSPQKLVTQAVTFIDKKIIAYTDGTLQAGTLYITNSENQYAITTPVSAFSHIRVYRYKNSLWQSY